jgi:archaellum component FlaC
VAAQITNVIGSLDALFADVNSLLNELSKLSPPVKGKKEPDAVFAARVKEFQQKVKQLNDRIEACYRKIGMAQAKLRHLQNTDLPKAERADAETMRKWLESTTAALEGAAKALKETKSEEKDKDEGELRVELLVQEKKIQLRGSDFNGMVQAFALVASLVGAPRVENPFVRMPGTPGAGLPPISAA